MVRVPWNESVLKEARSLALELLNGVGEGDSEEYYNGSMLYCARKLLTGEEYARLPKQWLELPAIDEEIPTEEQYLTDVRL